MSHYSCNNSHFFFIANHNLLSVYFIRVRTVSTLSSNKIGCVLSMFFSLCSIRFNSFFYWCNIRFERIFIVFEIRIVKHGYVGFFGWFIAFGETMRSYQHIHHHRQTKYVKFLHKCHIFPHLFFSPLRLIVVGYPQYWLLYNEHALQQHHHTTANNKINFLLDFQLFPFGYFFVCANIFQCNNSERKPEKDCKKRRRSNIKKIKDFRSKSPE